MSARVSTFAVFLGFRGIPVCNFCRATGAVELSLPRKSRRSTLVSQCDAIESDGLAEDAIAGDAGADRQSIGADSGERCRDYFERD
jgi:hypothetical protein